MLCSGIVRFVRGCRPQPRTCYKNTQTHLTQAKVCLTAQAKQNNTTISNCKVSELSTAFRALWLVNKSWTLLTVI